MDQQTIRRPFQIEGVGIHTGVRGTVLVEPAAPNFGRTFICGGVTLPAHVRYVVDTARCTTLGRDGATVSTVEHLLSALAGCGIDNCTMTVMGPEIPILDGSALPIVQEIQAAGIEVQQAPARFLELAEAVSVELGASRMRAEPAAGLRIEAITEFAQWPEGAASVTSACDGGVPGDYARAIAPARTFAFRNEVEMLIAAGLAKGGSLDNALIVEPPDTFSSPLRLPHEWCAHKLLDVLGDLALLNARLRMSVTATQPGHRANVALAEVIAARSHESIS